MSDIVTPLLQWLNANPEWAGLVTFVISAAESIAIIGTIVPGSVTMTAIGALAGAGVIPLGGTLFWAILGAIVGDGISYWMGYYFKDRIKIMWPFKNNPGILDKGELFVHKYGVMSVFIGRFVGPVRALVPMVAGMLGMRPLLFTLANVASAIGWAPAYMLPGILLGAASLELPPDIAIHVMLVFLIIILFIVLCIWIIYKIIMLINVHLNQMQTKLWTRLQKSRYLSPMTVVLRHHDVTKSHGQFSLALLFLVASTLLIALMFYVKIKGAPNILINDATFHFFRGFSFRTDSLDRLMIRITLLGQSTVIVPVVIALGFWFLIIRRYWSALHLIMLLAFAGCGIFVIKHIAKIERPWGLLHPLESYSMPSGHTVLSVSIYFGIALLIVNAIKPLRRPRYYLLPFIIAVAVSISRLYLGAHWFTDVLAGWLLAIALLAFVIISYQRRRETPPGALSILAVTIGTLILSYSFYYWQHSDLLKVQYVAKAWPTRELDIQTWWKRDGDLSAYRVSLFGFPSQRINIQWLGDLEAIRKTLYEEGWAKPPARDWISTIHRITDVSSSEYLPMISPQYLDKTPALIMTRFIDSIRRILVIRLWDAHRTINGEKLWVGTVSYVPRTYGWVFKSIPTEVSIDGMVVFTKKSPTPEWEWRILNLTVINTQKKRRPLQLRMMLVRKSSY